MTFNEFKQMYEKTYLQKVKDFYTYWYKLTIKSFEKIPTDFILEAFNNQLLDCEIALDHHEPNREAEIALFKLNPNEEDYITLCSFNLNFPLNKLIDSVHINFLKNTVFFDLTFDENEIIDTETQILTYEPNITSIFGNYLIKDKSFITSDYYFVHRFKVNLDFFA